MKIEKTIYSLIVVVALATGCGQSDQGADTDASQVRKETGEAVAAGQDYTYAQRDEFAAKIRAELSQIDAQLKDMAAKVETSAGEAKEQAKAKLETLRAKSATLEDQLSKVSAATEETWEEVKAGCKKAYHEVKESLSEAQQWLSQKFGA